MYRLDRMRKQYEQFTAAEGYAIGFHIGDGGDGQWFSWKHSDWKNFNFDYSLIVKNLKRF